MRLAWLPLKESNFLFLTNFHNPLYEVWKGVDGLYCSNSARKKFSIGSLLDSTNRISVTKWFTGGCSSRANMRLMLLWNFQRSRAICEENIQTYMESWRNCCCYFEFHSLEVLSRFVGSTGCQILNTIVYYGEFTIVKPARYAHPFWSIAAYLIHSFPVLFYHSSLLATHFPSIC